MNGPTKLAAPLIAVLAMTACNAGGGSASLPATTSQSGVQAFSAPAMREMRGTPACPGDRMHGLMQCDALIESSLINPNVPGWSAASLEAAYNLPVASKGKGQVVAVVDAYDNPNVASDLAEYRTENNLPTANFTKYNQKGQTSNYPTGNKGWGVEIDLDVDMVSASCPNCTIILVEANSNSGSDLYASEKEAVALGATIVTNSWGGGSSGNSHGDFDTKGVTYLASSGDGGYGMQDPADFTNVVAVGGTILSQSGSAYKEYVWPSSGGGCSVKTAKPSWQKDPGCKQRTGNEVSAVAQGVSEYDTYGYSGWIVIGGTSVSSPLIAGVFGLAGNSSKFAVRSRALLEAQEERAREGPARDQLGQRSLPGEPGRQLPLHRRDESVRRVFRTDGLGNAQRHRRLLRRPFQTG